MEYSHDPGWPFVVGDAQLEIFRDRRIEGAARDAYVARMRDFRHQRPKRNRKLHVHLAEQIRVGVSESSPAEVWLDAYGHHNVVRPGRVAGVEEFVCWPADFALIAAVDADCRSRLAEVDERLRVNARELARAEMPRPIMAARRAVQRGRAMIPRQRICNSFICWGYWCLTYNKHQYINIGEGVVERP